MAPTDRLVPRFAAEPPQEGSPYGRWAETLQAEFLAACLQAAADAAADEEPLDVGQPTDIVWFPDRTWEARTWIPASTRTTTGVELFGHVSFRPATADEEADEFEAHAEATDVLAEANPDWKVDISDHVIGDWRGEVGKVADMTLVWGTPLITGGAIACAELAGVTTDQCPLVDGRFTLLAPDWPACIRAMTCVTMLRASSCSPRNTSPRFSACISCASSSLCVRITMATDGLSILAISTILRIFRVSGMAMTSIAARPGQILEVPIADPSLFLDIDTPADVEHVSRLLSQSPVRGPR